LLDLRGVEVGDSQEAYGSARLQLGQRSPGAREASVVWCPRHAMDVVFLLEVVVFVVFILNFVRQ
jgi:hypothetical protein